MAEYTLTTRAKALKKYSDELSKDLYNISKNATLRAVEKASDLTPPTMNDLKGTNTRTGAMKQHWATDSVIRPQKKGSGYVTYLKNNMDYASYVNDGHRLDRHFVPGLIINNGMLEYNPNGKGGIIVGTKTTYVNGLFIVDKAKQTYKKVVKTEADKLIRELEK